MKNIIIKNGLYITLIIVGIPVLGYLIEGPVTKDAALNSEIVGYGSMVLSLAVFIFLGARKYRNEINNGRLTFLEGIKIGLLITLIPALAFAIYNHIYVEWIDPAFMENYWTWSVESMKEKLNPADFEAWLSDMEAQREMFSNPFFSFIIMFLTVFLIGLIVTLLVALGLRKPSHEVSVAQ